MSIEASPSPEAVPTGWNKKEVHQFAAKVAADLGYKPGESLDPIVAKLGGRIVENDWESARATGSIQIIAPRDFVINLSPLSGGPRKRFTVAHELGHYILHSRVGTIPMTIRRDGSGRVEWEANWFAAGFLMPEQQFVEKVKLGWSDAQLAEHFDVSEAAAKFRRDNVAT